MATEGGFGGLGIGNPGSYGGQQSVGAPGFGGQYADGASYTFGDRINTWVQNHITPQTILPALGSLFTTLATGNIALGAAAYKALNWVADTDAIHDILADVEAGSLTPEQATQLAGEKFESGELMAGLSEENAIQAFIEQTNPGMSGPARFDLENTYWDLLRPGYRADDDQSIYAQQVLRTLINSENNSNICGHWMAHSIRRKG